MTERSDAAATGSVRMHHDRRAVKADAFYPDSDDALHLQPFSVTYKIAFTNWRLLMLTLPCCCGKYGTRELFLCYFHALIIAQFTFFKLCEHNLFLCKLEYTASHDLKMGYAEYSKYSYTWRIMHMRANTPRKKTYTILQNALYLYRDIYQNDRSLFIYLLIETIFKIVMPFFGIYLPKLAIEVVTTQSDIKKALISLLVFILLFSISSMILSFAEHAKIQHQQNLGWHYMRKLFHKTLTCDYLLIESAQGQNLYQKARRSLDCGQSAATWLMISSICCLIVAIISFFLYSSIILTLNPIILIVILGISIINYYSLRHAQNYEQGKKDDISEHEKKINYIATLSADIRVAKDSRVFSVPDWLKRIHATLMTSYIKLLSKVRKRYSNASIIHAVTLLVRDGMAYVYLIWSVVNGLITIDNFVLYFGAVTTLSTFFNQIIDNTHIVNRANLQMNDIRDFLSIADIPDPDEPMPLPSPDTLLSIEFRDVSYSYEEQDTKILDHLNLKINPGEALALVGLNGAGKTTLIKLLCGFYQPSSGSILINDININRFRKKDLFRLFSVLFQDIMIFPFTIAENIALRQSSQIDRDKIETCIEIVGLSETIRKCKNGLDSMMLKYPDPEGVILSGGQQQKLLMARALYKDAPVLILDEPTAALDPIAENEMYENFYQMAKHKTTIFISHRLASTRFCDTIVLLSNGKIVEQGTHAELMKQDGDYANIYTIQSHYYKNQKDEQVNSTVEENIL